VDRAAERDVSVRRSRDVPALVARARDGDPRAIARLVSLVEDGDECLPELAAALAPHTGTAAVIGLTGSPGVGKSTTTSELVRAYRAQGARVGVLAVDPSSPFSGGAILGDRVRMQDHATDPGVYIRSMSSRGHLGGLAAATPQAVRVLEGAGCDVVLIETVGVGQAEVEVASLADTTLVLLAPGMGDAIQAAKAGILEVADIFVVNKADRDGADATYHDIQGMIALGERGPGQWRPQVLRTVAARAEGIDEVVTAIAKHRAWLSGHDQLTARRLRRATVEIEEIALGVLRGRMGTLAHGDALPALAADVVAGRLDPYAAARRLLAQLDGPRAGDNSLVTL
jgi:LAO/AO transport system kinase